MRVTMTTRVVVSGAAAALVLGGCASMPESRPDDLPNGKPAVTDQQAARVMTEFDELTNAANSQYDDELLEDILAEPLLETSQTSLVLAEAREDEPGSPFFHTNVRGISPRFTEYPMWFLARSTIDNDPGRISVEVLSRESATSEWIVEQSAGLGAVTLPEFDAAGNATTEAAEADIAQIEELLEQVASYLEGEDVDDLDLSAFDNYREWVENSTIDEPQVTSPDVSCERDERVTLRALGTSDGALGMAAVTCTITQEIQETIDATMSLGGELAALAPDPGRRVVFVSSHPVVVTTSAAGSAELFSGGWRWSDVTMHDE
jgi:hypothetical protein